MKTFMFTMVTVLLFAKSSFARIGETEAVIGRRYGKPLKSISENSLENSKGYRAKGFTIIVTYLNGKSVCEMFIKDGNTQWSQAEINQFIAREYGVTQRWEPCFNSGYAGLMRKQWIRSDNKLEATYFLPVMLPPLEGLEICSKDYSDAKFGWHYRKPAK